MVAFSERLPQRAWYGLASAGIMLLALVLVLLPLKLALALVGGLIVVAITLIEPAFGLYMAILSVPVQEAIQLPAGLTVTQATVLLAFGAWTLRVLAYPDRRLNLRLLLPWLVFLTIQLVSVALTPYSQTEGVLQWARWLAAFLAFVLTLGTITDQRRAWGLIAALLLAPAGAALLGLYQFATASAPESFLILGGRFARAYATFGKPNPFAGYLNMAWPLAVALGIFLLQGWRSGQQTSRKEPQALRATEEHGAAGPLQLGQLLGGWLVALILAGITLLLLVGLFASYSRGGWLGAIAGAGALAITAGRRSAALAGIALLLAVVLGLLGEFSVLPPAVTDRLDTITDNLRIFDAGEVAITDENFAIVERMAHWQAGWRMFRSAPLVGVGTGNFNAAYPDYFVAPWAISQGHAHNYYIHTLAESGILGLLSYVLLVGTMLFEALRMRRQLRGTIWGAGAVGVCGIIAAVAGHNIFENLHVLNLGIQLSGVWGLAICAQRWGNDTA